MIVLRKNIVGPSVTLFEKRTHVERATVDRKQQKQKDQNQKKKPQKDSSKTKKY